MFRIKLRAYLAATAIIAGAAVAPACLADTMSYVSEPGDWIGQGQTLSLSHGVIASASTDGNMIHASVTDGTVQGGHNIMLEMHAPQGEQLHVGAYAGVFPVSDATHGSLLFAGDGRGCTIAEGGFTIDSLVLGPYGYVQKLEAHWEQRCQGSTGWLYGQISIDKPAPPPPMEFFPTIDAEAVIDKSGAVTIGGTVRCTMATTADLVASVKQTSGSSKNVASFEYYLSLPCGPVASHWTATSGSGSVDTVKFTLGPAHVDVQAYAYDPVYYLVNYKVITGDMHVDNGKK
jgi:hypothetical protein